MNCCWEKFNPLNNLYATDKDTLDKEPVIIDSLRKVPKGPKRRTRLNSSIWISSRLKWSFSCYVLSITVQIKNWSAADAEWCQMTRNKKKKKTLSLPAALVFLSSRMTPLILGCRFYLIRIPTLLIILPPDITWNWIITLPQVAIKTDHDTLPCFHLPNPQHALSFRGALGTYIFVETELVVSTPPSSVVTTYLPITVQRLSQKNRVGEKLHSR